MRLLSVQVTIVDEMTVALTKVTAAFQAFSRELRRAMRVRYKRLTPMERARYRQLRKKGVLIWDALSGAKWLADLPPGRPEAPQ